MNTAKTRLMSEDIWHGKAFGGDWRALGGGATEVIEPATGERLTNVGLANADDVKAAAKAAFEAQAAWAATSFETRIAIMRKAASIFEENEEELAPWIMRETGAIRPKAGVELKYAAGSCFKAAALLTEPHGYVFPSPAGRTSLGRRIPRGVVGVISPFNFPLILSIRAVAPALAIGNAVVLKPDPQTSITGGYIIARVFEEAGLPPGVLQVLPGRADAGEALCADPHIAMISFTGSTAAGRKVGEVAGRNLKKVQLELGGKNPLVILGDADIDLAASNAAWGAYLHQGQICMATSRIIVHESIAERFTEKLCEKANHLPVGNPTSGKVALGPIINSRQLQHIDSVVKDTVAAGATLRAGGTSEGPFYRPTVLSGVRPGMRSFDEEIFGPVASITTFSSDDEAITLANRSEYGLSAAVISASSGRALFIGSQIHAGLLHINDQTVADEPFIPFGGVGASGNGDAIGGPANWDLFSHWQWVTIKEAPPAYPF
jgi:benzaldehyde dehydrogenase (NAD)